MIFYLNPAEHIRNINNRVIAPRAAWRGRKLVDIIDTFQLIGLLKWGKHSWVGLWFIQIWWIAHKGGVRFKVTLALAQQASRVVAERLGV